MYVQLGTEPPKSPEYGSFLYCTFFFVCFLFILSSPKGIKVKHSVNESLDVEEREGELCRFVSKVAS